MKKVTFSDVKYFAIVLLLVGLLSLFIHSLVQTRYENQSANGVLKGASTQLGYTGFFWSEAAFHFRTTLMYATDDFQGPQVLNRDIFQQHPQGVDAWREYSILMEPVLGKWYRWLGSKGQSLVEFLLWILPLLHSLLLIPIYLIARTLGSKPGLALAGALVFATSSLGFSPLLDIFYVKETFSWLIFGVFLVGHFSVLNSFRWSSLALATVALFFFLISWHLASFVAVVVFLASLLALLRLRPEQDSQPLVAVGWRGRQWVLNPTVLIPLGYLVAALFAGVVPWLFERVFYLSFPFVILVSWLTVSYFRVTQPRWFFSGSSRWFLGGAVILIAFLFSVANGRFSGDYSHVSGLLWYRLIHLFEKPWDPSELPFAVRVFWVSPFSSPRLTVLLQGIGFNLIPLVLSLAWAGTRGWSKRNSSSERVLALCLVGFAVGFLLVERLAPVFLFLGAIGVALTFSDWLKRFQLKWALIGLVVFPVLNLVFPMNDFIRVSWASMRGQEPQLVGLDRKWDQARVELFEWIRANTPDPQAVGDEKPEAIVAEIGMSPQILLYTGRPTVLNSQFENVEIRDRYQEYLESLFSVDEASLVGFFQQYQATYLLINRDWAVTNGRNTPKYLAGERGGLSLATNLASLTFEPESLGNFYLVFENGHYRLFKFGDSSALNNVQWKRTWAKWWNIENFQVENGRLARSSEDRNQLNELDRMFSALPGQLGELAFAIEQAWQKEHPGEGPRMDLMQLQRQLAEVKFQIAVSENDSHLEGRQVELEREVVGRLVETNPGTGQILQRDILAILNGNPHEGVDGVLKKLAPLTADPQEYAVVGQMLMLLGEFGLAGEMFGKGGTIYDKPGRTEDPGGRRPSEFQEYLWRETILNLVAAGKREQARGLARFCANHVAPGSENRAFFVQAGHLKLGS